MRKNILLLALAVIAASCTEKINLNLNSSEPQVVIEGNITNSGTIFKITKSVNMDDTNTFPPVENAVVEVTDGSGEKTILAQIQPGLYSGTMTSTDGMTYYMNVKLDGKEYTAESVAPNSVEMEDLIVEKSESGFGSKDSYDIKVVYKDPAAENNYYYFEEYINRELKGQFAYSDKFFNGSEKGSILMRGKRELKKGDEVMVVMKCIDKETYEYFSGLGYISGGNPTSTGTPANPVTNIKGQRVLGYFSAMTMNSKTVVVQ